MEERTFWAKAVDGATLGLAGAAQVLRIDRHVENLRRGRVLKTSDEPFYGVTSLWPEEAAPEVLFQRVREYWAIETKQHYRRDHTQREDHCQVRHTRAARDLALMRSASIFLYERQRRKPSGKQSLPDWQRKNMRQPKPPIGKLTGQPGSRASTGILPRKATRRRRRARWFCLQDQKPAFSDHPQPVPLRCSP